MQEILLKDIKYIQGIGPKRAELLNKELNIFTYRDLLYYFPYRYIDRSQFYKINEINGEMQYVQLRGEISHIELMGNRTKKRLAAYFSDGTGTIELVWFQGVKWIKESLKLNTPYIVFGKPTYFNRQINIAHPEMEELAKTDQKIQAGFQAMYNTTEKLKDQFITSKTLSKLINNLMMALNGKIQETIPDYLVSKENLISLNAALFNIHFPQNPTNLKKAIYRLKFEELFWIQLNLLKQKAFRANKFAGFKFEKVGDYFNFFYKNNLKFELTEAQKNVIREIRKDVGSGKQMNRLLQGDVGSGKTLVALMSMLLAVDNGYQACLMSPTEILANQHYNTISGFLEGMNINVRLLRFCQVC